MTPNDIAIIANQTRFVNGYLCKSCFGPAFEMQNKDALVKGYGECCEYPFPPDGGSSLVQRTAQAWQPASLRTQPPRLEF